MDRQRFPNQPPPGGYTNPMAPIPPYGNYTNQGSYMYPQQPQFPYGGSGLGFVPHGPLPNPAYPRYDPAIVGSGQGFGANPYQPHAITTQQPVSGIPAIPLGAPFPPLGPYGSMIPGNVSNPVPAAFNPPPPTPPSSEAPPQKKRRRKGTSCDECRKQHQPCGGERPHCPRCIRLRKICTYGQFVKPSRPKPHDPQPLADHILGAVIRSNPRLEQLIVQELQHGIQPGTNVTNLEYLRDEAARSTLKDAFRSSRIFQVACTDKNQGVQGAAGAFPALPSLAPPTVAPVAAPGPSIVASAATPGSAGKDDPRPPAKSMSLEFVMNCK
ncbi:hypothetical protein M434DRAFT_220085 [Hypoxylon sp. CO27-5]|nr:hypothetical protein M434DRAFT_220085 [Hypoxylon sp. CO27-5]